MKWLGERVARRAIGTSFCMNYNSIANDVIPLQNNTVLLNAKNYKKHITQDGPLCNISCSKDCRIKKYHLDMDSFRFILISQSHFLCKHHRNKNPLMHYNPLSYFDYLIKETRLGKEKYALKPNRLLNWLFSLDAI